MKKLSKVLVLVLSAIMVLAMSASVFAAAGTPGITIQPNNDEASTQSVAITYTYYKIMTASIDTDAAVNPDTGATTTDGVVSYYVTNANQATALNGTGLFKVTQVSGQDKWYVALKDSATTAEQIVAAFNNAEFLANFTKQEYTKEAGTANAVLPGITAGYYYIQSSLGTKAAVQTLSPVTIKEKNTYPGLEKDYSNQTDALAGIGDEITYTIKVSIPASVASKPIKITDTMTKGLTMDTAVTVSGAVADPAYTSATWVKDDEASTAEKNVYTIEIPAATVLANKGKELTFTYKATVNENAVVLVPETNTAHLDYDQFSTKDVDVVSTKTLAFTLEKVDGTDHAAGTITELPGAEFSLWDAATDGNKINLVKVSDGVYRVATAAEASAEGFESAVIEAGLATINGLNDATYYLQEDLAPTGYNQLTERVAVSVTETTSAQGVDTYVDNNKGTQLPTTGGIGTTIFYVLGSLLVIGCGIVLVSRKRMQNNK